MNTEPSETSAGAGAAHQGETAQPEQNAAGLAHPQGEAPQGADATDEAADAAGGEEKNLTDEQRELRKLRRRIDRLTAKRGGVERENELLRQQLEQLSTRQPRAEGNSGQEEGEQRPQRRELSEADIERLATARAAELQQQAAIGERVAKVLEAGSKIEGFDTAVDAVAEVIPFRDGRGRPTAFIEAVLDADDPAGVLKYLGDNPDEAEDLALLKPAQLGRRLAKLEDQLKQGAKIKTSAAPRPLKPVNGTGGVDTEADPSKDVAAWIRQRNKAEASRA